MWGGAVDTFCASNDKTALFSPTMETITGVTKDQANTGHNRASPYGMYEQGIPINTTGISGIAYYHLQNMVADTTIPPTIECMFRGKVVDGWDDGPIEVHVPSLEYSKYGNYSR